MLTDQLDQSPVGLGHVLAGAGAGRRDVAGQCERAAAEVHGVQRCAGLAREVHDMGEPLHVLEFEVLRIVEVDVRLRGAVDREQPRPVPVHIGQQPGGAEVGGADDGYRLVHAPIVP